MSFMGGWRDAIASKINKAPVPVDDERMKEDKVHVSLSNNGNNLFTITPFDKHKKNLLYENY
jgi:hypothetical protein